MMLAAVTDSRQHDRLPHMDNLTDTEVREVLQQALADPMQLIIDRLNACEDSSLHIATQVNVSASTIRTLRAGQHSGNLRVDVWAELLHWLLLPEPEEAAETGDA